MPRHSRILGRTDDTFIFRGVNIYPSSIDSILSTIGGLGSEYQIHLSRDAERGRDSLKLVVERGQGVSDAGDRALIGELLHQFKRQLLVTPEVELVAYGSLPRSERKSQRVFDARITDSII
jgi:phenylacetate-CoA ligase